MTYSKQGIYPQVTNRRATALKSLSKLYRFNMLSTETKRRLFMTIIRPKLLYPIVSLNTLSKTQTSRLQTVQNRALHEICRGGYPSWSSPIPHSAPPTWLSTGKCFIHNRASDLWTKMRLNCPDIHGKIWPNDNDPPRRKSGFLTCFVNEDNPLPGIFLISQSWDGAVRRVFNGIFAMRQCVSQCLLKLHLLVQGLSTSVKMSLYKQSSQFC